MYIKKIVLTNFRNYEKEEICLEDAVNIIYGNNAQGKTNIIESIFLSAIGKSFRAKKENELIKFGEDFAKIEIEFQKKDREGKIEIKIDNKKTFYLNGIKQNRISDIVGNINIVLFTPDDIEIVKDGPNKRRRFLDMMISSLKPNYLYVLNLYNKVLDQRNNYLRNNKEIDSNMMDIWDEQLTDYSEKIFNYRKEYIEKLEENQKDIHKKITESGKEEEIKIEYISNFKNKERFLKELKYRRKQDLKKGFTTIGIHRDDFIIYINNRNVGIYCSQGQQRTVVLSLKLAELKVVEQEIGEKPILLLDDFMSELDETRKNQFIKMIDNDQVIITGTEKIEIENKKIKNFYVESGKIN